MILFCIFICCLFAIMTMVFYKTRDSIFEYLNKKERVECCYVTEILLIAAASQNVITYDLFNKFRYYDSFSKILFDKEIAKQINEISEKLITYSTKLVKNEIDDDLLQIRIWCEQKRKGIKSLFKLERGEI